MNWFQRAQLPDRFNNMSPDQIEAEIKRLESLQQENESLKGSAPPKVEESEAYRTLQTQLQEAQQKLQQLSSAPPPEEHNRPPQLTSFLEDEDRAFQERATPLFNMTLLNTSMMARQLAEQDLKEDSDPVSRESNKYVLSAYQKEVNELYNSMPLQARTAPDAFKNVVGVVKHRHFQDVFKAISGKAAQFETGGRGDPSDNGGENLSPEKVLTAGQLRVAAKMKISPAQYLASLKGMKVATETTGYAEVKQ